MNCTKPRLDGCVISFSLTEIDWIITVTIAHIISIPFATTVCQIIFLFIHCISLFLLQVSPLLFGCIGSSISFLFLVPAVDIRILTFQYQEVCVMSSITYLAVSLCNSINCKVCYSTNQQQASFQWHVCYTRSSRLYTNQHQYLSVHWT